MPELIDAARPRLAADGVPVDGAAITVTSGTLDAIERLLTAHLRPGDAVAVEDPGWANLLDLLAALGLRPVPVAVDEEGPDARRAGRGAAGRARARSSSPSARRIRPAPRSPPTGRPSCAEVLADHPERPADRGRSRRRAGRRRRCTASARSPTSWAFVRSASKPFGPDLRIAVVAGDETTIARVVGRMRIGTGWVSTVLQRLLLHLWRDEEVTAAVAAAAPRPTPIAAGLCATLSARGASRPTARPASTSGSASPTRPARSASCATRGTRWRPGSLFRIDAPPGIRITISPLDESEIPPLADAVAAAVRPVGHRRPSR